VLQDQVLGSTLIPQLVLRIGFAPDAQPLPATPRRPIRAFSDRSQADRI
jgi:hypothetical protein